MLKRDKSIQEWRSKVFGRQHLKNLKLYGQVIFFKGGLPQILLGGAFLNNYSQILFCSFF